METMKQYCEVIREAGFEDWYEMQVQDVQFYKEHPGAFKTWAISAGVDPDTIDEWAMEF